MSFHAEWTFSITSLEVCGPSSSISSLRQIVPRWRSNGPLITQPSVPSPTCPYELKFYELCSCHVQGAVSNQHSMCSGTKLQSRLIPPLHYCSLAPTGIFLAMIKDLTHWNGILWVFIQVRILK